MSKIQTFQDLEKKMSNFNLSNYQATICKNIKRIRKELYDEYKQYYKRLESYDKTKPISIRIFLKVVVLLDRDISEFLK